MSVAPEIPINAALGGISQTDIPERRSPRPLAALADPDETHAPPADVAGTLERQANVGWTIADPLPMTGPMRAGLRGVIRAACPPPPAPQLPDQEARIEVAVRRQLRYMGTPVVWVMRLAVVVLDLAPLWCFVSWRRLRSLDRERAGRLFQRLCHSRWSLVRTLTLVVRATVYTVYYDQDVVHETIGYTPGKFIKARIALRERWKAGQTPGDEDMLVADPAPSALPDGWAGGDPGRSEVRS